MTDLRENKNLDQGIPHQNKNIPFRSRYIVIIIISILAILFVPWDALDSYRYYNLTKTFSRDDSLLEFIKQFFYHGIDFVYYLLLFICVKLGIPIQFITGISVGLLYAQTLTLIDNIQVKYGYKINKSNKLLIRLFALFSVSFIPVFAISRNVTAIMFFVFGVNSMVKGKKLKTALYFLLAVFTHVSMILYSILYIFGYYWKGKFILNINKRRIIIVLATIVGLNSFLWIDFIMRRLESLTFFVNYPYYSVYVASGGGFSNLFHFELGKGELLMFYPAPIALFFGLFFIKKYNPIIWVCFIMYISLIISMGFSLMFTQRTLLFLIPFQGVVASSFFEQKNGAVIKLIYILLLILSIFAFFLNVLYLRNVLDFEFPV